MADVVRFVRNVEEVVYTVGPETIRRALMGWLIDQHGAGFNAETVVRFCGDSVTLTTRFHTPELGATPTPAMGDV